MRRPCLGAFAILGVIFFIYSAPQAGLSAQGTLLEIKFDGVASEMDGVEKQIGVTTKAIAALLAQPGITANGPQNAGYSLNIENGQFRYSGYVFFDILPPEKGADMLALLKKQGYTVEFGQRCGGPK